MAQKIFELNGKAYDALTGAYLGSAKRPQHTVNVQYMQPKPVPQHSKSSGVSMDGMVSPTQRRTAAAATPKHLSAHQPQPTKTLMRRAVKKPASLQPVQASAQTPTGDAAFRAVQPSLRPAQPYRPGVGTKLSSDVIDPMRARRAQGVKRSQSVKHFKSTAAVPTNPYALPSAAQPQASVRPALPATRTNLGRATYRPQRPAPASVDAAPARMAAASQPAPTHAPTTLSFDDNDDEQDLFAEALAHASSHEEETPKEVKSHSSSRRKRQILGIVASLSVFALLFGFIAVQNKDNIRLQLASAKAGFSAAVPLNMPSGYAMDKLNYAPGNVGMVFSKGSNQNFSITQKKSNWDSQTLLENFVATSNEDYKGYQSNGRTVYVYGKGKATWVNGGIWYQLKDNGSLSDEQLVRIAASM